MGGRAVLAAILGAAVVAIVVSLAGRLPKPEEPVEWLQREDAVIVQRKGLAVADSELATRAAVPDFTLYGDGTAIVLQFTTEGALLVAGRLEDGAVENLLEFIDDQGFFDSAYELAPPDPTSETTTYLYVQTKLAANSVAAVDLDQGAGQEQLRRVRKISQRLDEVARELTERAAYEPDAGLLLVRPLDPGPSSALDDWAYDIDLIELVDRQPALGVVSRPLDDDATHELLQRPDSALRCWFRARQAGRLFDVCVRPVLPFEEHFPEFEPPQQ